MTKKHFIALADVIIRSAPADRSAHGVFSDSAIKALADFCASQSPSFDRERWLAYIEGRKVKSSTPTKPKS